MPDVPFGEWVLLSQPMSPPTPHPVDACPLCSGSHRFYGPHLPCGLCGQVHTEPYPGNDHRPAWGYDYDPDDCPHASEDERQPALEYYSFNPGWVQHGEGNAQYGMEIEISSQTTNPVRRARQITGDLCVFKEDSSVAGFEMVTHPMAYPWAMANFPWDVLPALKEEGCEIDPDDNGIHVHVAKAGFTSPAHVYRWMKLIYRNSGQVERMARRHAGHWASFSESHKRGQFQHVYKGRKPHTTNVWRYDGRTGGYAEFTWSPGQRGLTSLQIEDLMYPPGQPTSTELRDSVRQQYVTDGRTWFPVIRRMTEREFDHLVMRQPVTMIEDIMYGGHSQSHDPTMDDRYSAINTQNDSTYEVRLFASTLEAAEAKAALQLCASSVEYTRSLSAHDIIHNDGWAWDTYKSWVQSDDVYPELAWALDRRVSFSRGRYI